MRLSSRESDPVGSILCIVLVSVPSVDCLVFPASILLDLDNIIVAIVISDTITAIVVAQHLRLRLFLPDVKNLGWLAAKTCLVPLLVGLRRLIANGGRPRVFISNRLIWPYL